MRIRIYNARILAMNGDTRVTAGEIGIEDDKILYVGSPVTDAGDKPLWDREIDAGGNLIMPGFKNAHTHSAMTFLRSYADDLPLQEWQS